MLDRVAQASSSSSLTSALLPNGSPVASFLFLNLCEQIVLYR